MVRATLIIAAIVYVALAALMVAVSGFLFGSGPESMHGGVLLTAAYAAGVIACLAAPIAGFVFNGRGKTGAGVLVAWLPQAGALVALAIPAPYLSRAAFQGLRGARGVVLLSAFVRRKTR